MVAPYNNYITFESISYHLAVRDIPVAPLYAFVHYFSGGDHLNYLRGFSKTLCANTFVK